MSDTPTHEERAQKIAGRYFSQMTDTGYFLGLSKYIATALRDVERAAYERAAKWHDERAAGCRNVAATIRREWISPENSKDDNRANAQDAREHDERAKHHDLDAKAIRALASEKQP